MKAIIKKANGILYFMKLRMLMKEYYKYLNEKVGESQTFLRGAYFLILEFIYSVM